MIPFAYWGILRFVVKYVAVMAAGAYLALHFYADPKIEVLKSDKEVLEAGIKASNDQAKRDIKEKEDEWKITLQKEKAQHETIIASLNADHQLAINGLRSAVESRRARLRAPEARPTVCSGFAAAPADLRVKDAEFLRGIAAECNHAAAERNEAIQQLNDLYHTCTN
jgi:hypothetical protein